MLVLVAVAMGRAWTRELARRELAFVLTALALLPACSRRPLPELGHVPAFELVSQDGHAFGSRELAGTPYVAAFMFTRCPSICPRVTQNMKKVLRAAQNEGRALRMVSISIDGENDTPPVLRAYAQKFGLDLQAWTLLTGRSEEVSAAAERSFKVGVSGSADAQKPHFGLTHGSHLVLVDGRGEIRGYYASQDDSKLAELVSDLARL